jgi:hypothetical protein
MTAVFAGRVIAAPIVQPGRSLWALIVAGVVSGCGSFD